MPGLLFSVVLLAPVIGVAYEPGHGYMVHGGIGCATYTAQYDFNLQKRLGEGMVTMEFSQTHGWIKGYLTAYNAWARNDRIDVQGLTRTISNGGSPATARNTRKATSRTPSRSS